MMMKDAPTTKAKQRDALAHANRMLRYAYATESWSQVDAVIALLDQLSVEMRNRPPLQRGRVTADSVTPAKVAEVLALRAEQPKLAQKEIALRLRIDVGRVSEILHGKRT
jgi:hypothetical protein